MWRRAWSSRPSPVTVRRSMSTRTSISSSPPAWSRFPMSLQLIVIAFEDLAGLVGDDYQLKCKTEEVETDEEDEKKVFEPSATGGTEVKQGTEITVKVAKKPSEPSPTMPSVPGGIPTSPSDDGGSDDDGNDDGDDDDKDKDT